MPRFSRLVAGWVTSIALTSSIGCSARKFPQYTGTYALVSVSARSATGRHAPELVGKPPARVRITHRMAWSGSAWTHTLGILALPSAGEEASGTTSVSLADLTRFRTGCGGGARCELSGLEYRSKRPTDGTAGGGAFCAFHGYAYNVFASEISPAPALLDRIYADHGTVEAAGQRIRTQLTSPEDADVDEEASRKWYERVDSDEGAYVTLELTKDAISDYSGCSGEFPLVDGDRDLGSVTLKYVLVRGTIDYGADLRSAGDSDARGVSHPDLLDELAAFR